MSAQKILPGDPFESIDQDGVGQLMEIAVERGKKTRPDIKLGICGEHGGEPRSIAFCHKIGLNYVSAAPRSACPSLASRRRRPTWRTAAATATDKHLAVRRKLQQLCRNVLGGAVAVLWREK